MTTLTFDGKTEKETGTIVRQFIDLHENHSAPLDDHHKVIEEAGEEMFFELSYLSLTEYVFLVNNYAKLKDTYFVSLSYPPELLGFFEQLDRAMASLRAEYETLLEYAAIESEEAETIVANSIAIDKALNGHAKNINAAIKNIKNFERGLIEQQMALSGKLKWKTNAGSASIGNPTIRGSIRQAQALNDFLLGDIYAMESISSVDNAGNTIESMRNLGSLAEVLSPYVSIRHQAGSLTIR